MITGALCVVIIAYILIFKFTNKTEDDNDEHGNW